MKELRAMLGKSETQVIGLQKLIIVSLTEIFKDIIPDYRIRLWSEEEKKIQVLYSLVVPYLCLD